MADSWPTPLLQIERKCIIVGYFHRKNAILKYLSATRKMGDRMNDHDDFFSLVTTLDI